MPVESPIPDAMPASGDFPLVDDGPLPPYSIDADGRVWVRADLVEDEPPATAYPCTARDISALISFWWSWVPKRPTRHGKIIPAKAHYANHTNREYARTLVERGVLPADFARCLGELALEDDPRAGHEMTFCYAAAIVEDWVARDRAENWYTDDCPRITPRRPGARIDLGEIGDLAGPDLFERFASHPDLIIDVPPPYLSPDDLEPEEDLVSWPDTVDEDFDFDAMGMPL